MRIVALAALLWIAVVIAGAGPEADDSLLGVKNLDVVWAILLALGAASGVAMLIWLNPFSREWIEPKPTRRRGVGALMLIGLAVLLWWPELVGRFAEEEEETEGEAIDEEAAVDVADAEPVEVVAQASDLLLLLGAVAILVGGVWLMRRRPVAAADHEQSTQAFEDELVETMHELSRELRAARDPREAVLNAYALLEAVLATHGFRRIESETATEHVRRSLRGLSVQSSPFVRLGELYEVARFSTHQITPADQHAAAAALDDAQSLLGGRPEASR